jgi:hypothetical protein
MDPGRTMNGDGDQHSDGSDLTKMLELHRSFIERGYFLLKFVQGEFAPHGLRLVQYGGAARNGFGAGLPIWIRMGAVSYLGIALVPDATPTVSKQGSRLTVVPDEGLRCLLFQIRWLERSREQPVVWIVDLHVNDVAPESRVELEPYYAILFKNLQADPKSGLPRAGQKVSRCPPGLSRSYARQAQEYVNPT